MAAAMTEARTLESLPVSLSAARLPLLSGLPSALALRAAERARALPHWIAVVDSQRLRRVRRERGLSRERLAHAAGLGLSTVARLESQPRARCHVRTLGLLARALDQPAATLAVTGSLAAQDARGIGAVPDPDVPARSSWTCSRTFPARPDQVALARAFLRRVLAGCPVLEDMVLICSELASNAIVHSRSAEPGGWFTVRAEVREGDYAWVEVQDQGGRWAQADQRERHGHGGRGLEIVGALADYWDIRGDDTGRVVCARLDWPGPPGDAA
jgi:anti-sigma regulatory factor (Ser/Thr protein kinase)/DNA-binding XRE family transcriptional regulator